MPVDPKFQVEGVPHQTFFSENYPKWSFVWYKNLHTAFFRCHKSCVWRTDRQNSFGRQYVVIYWSSAWHRCRCRLYQCQKAKLWLFFVFSDGRLSVGFGMFVSHYIMDYTIWNLCRNTRPFILIAQFHKMSAWSQTSHKNTVNASDDFNKADACIKHISMYTHRLFTV